MKKTRIFIILSFVGLFIIVTAGITLAADDGPLFRRNISRTPDTMTGASQMSVMPLYVAAQDPQGLAVTIVYSDTEGGMIYERTEAKPIIATYNDGLIPEETPEGNAVIMTGTGFGERDVFAALSLDDGATWKNYNLSDSALRSSFVLKDGHDYPGDVFRVNHVVVGNRIAVAWISRFC